jgi:hypothetical protein
MAKKVWELQQECVALKEAHKDRCAICQKIKCTGKGVKKMFTHAEESHPQQSPFKLQQKQCVKDKHPGCERCRQNRCKSREDVEASANDNHARHVAEEGFLPYRALAAAKRELRRTCGNCKADPAPGRSRAATEEFVDYHARNHDYFDRLSFREKKQAVKFLVEGECERCNRAKPPLRSHNNVVKAYTKHVRKHPVGRGRTAD